MTTMSINPPSSASQSSPTEDDYNTQIDALLTRYLLLLDEYTTLRSSLSGLQAGMYQNLARANFTAERGVRYGKEYFDERMVASRRVLVKVGAGKGKGKGDKKEEEEEQGGWWCGDEGEQKVEFRVVKVDEGGDEVVMVKEKEDEEKEEEDEEEDAKKETDADADAAEVVSKDNEAKEEDVTQRADTTTTAKTTIASPDKDSKPLSNPNDDTDTPDGDKDNEGKKKIRKNDPLRWFGLLTPLPLRLAQTQAIQAVEQIVPRLVTVNAEMAQVEIEVRRARKRREKAAIRAKGKAAAAAKDAE